MRICYVKNSSPQLKDENNNLDNSKNTACGMQKLHSSKKHNEYTILLNELQNAQTEATNLKIVHHKFTFNYIDQLLCFCENLYKDISKFLELEHDQQKILHLINALNEIDAIATYSNKIVDFAEAITGITPLLNKKIISKKLLNKGIALRALNKNEEAIKTYNEILSRNPISEVALKEKAYITVNFLS